MSQCWASVLGDCSKKISREHLISRVAFSGDLVQVEGFPWCKGLPKVIGLESAVAKNLCESHNSRLSVLDAEIGHLQRTVEWHCSRYNTSNRRLAGRLPRRELNAKLIERWLLKTLINMQYGGPYAIGPEATTAGQPSKDLVEICFGQRSFPTRAGMYVAAFNGMNVTMTETFTFSPLHKLQSQILGGFFTAYGLHFFLALTKGGIPVPLVDIPNVGENWMRANLQWRFRKIRAHLQDGSLSHEIRFKWI
jgi:hypothetical protein